MPAASAFKPPRPAPRKSEPTPRTNAGFIELSDSSDDDVPRAAQPAAAHTLSSRLSQKPSAGTGPQPAEAQTPGRRVPRDSLAVQKETPTPSGPASTAKSTTTGSTSAAPAAPAKRKAQVAAKIHPSSGATAAQSPAKLPRTTGSAAQPIHSAFEQPAGAGSTSNPPPSASSSSSKQLRPPTPSGSRSNTATEHVLSVLLKKHSQARPSPSTPRTEPRGPPSSASQPATSAFSRNPAASSTSRVAPLVAGAAASSDSDSDSEIEILSVGGVACAPTQRNTPQAQSTGPTREREQAATQSSVRATAARQGTLADGSASGLRRQPSPSSAAPVRDRSSSAGEAVDVEECEPDERAKSSKSGVIGAASEGVKEGTSVAARAQSDEASPAPSPRPSAPEGAAHAVQQEQQPSGFAGSSLPEGSTTPMPQAVPALVSTSAASMGGAGAPGAVRGETPELRGFADSPTSSDAGHDVRSATDAAGIGARSALGADAVVAAAVSSAARTSSTPTSEEDDVMRESGVDRGDAADEVTSTDRMAPIQAATRTSSPTARTRRLRNQPPRDAPSLCTRTRTAAKRRRTTTSCSCDQLRWAHPLACASRRARGRAEVRRPPPPPPQTDAPLPSSPHRPDGPSLHLLLRRARKVPAASRRANRQAGGPPRLSPPSTSRRSRARRRPHPPRPQRLALRSQVNGRW